MRVRRIPVRDDGAILLDKRRRASRHNSNRKCQCEPRLSHQIQPQFWSDIDFVSKTMMMKFAQTRFLALTEIEEKVILIIFSAELRRNFRLCRDEVIHFFQVVIAEPPQVVGNFFRVVGFWSNQPKRENEWKIDYLFPFFAQIPKAVVGMLLPKSNCLITDEQTEHGPLACAPSGHAVRCLSFNGSAPCC